MSSSPPGTPSPIHGVSDLPSDLAYVLPSTSGRTACEIYQFLTFPAFKLTDQEVIEFYGRNATNAISGAPALDLRYAVDGQRELTIHRPLPKTSTGVKFELRNKVIGVFDKGKAGSAIETEQQIVNTGTDEVYTTTCTVSFVPEQGNWGGPRGKSPIFSGELRENGNTDVRMTHIQGPPTPIYLPPDRTPDATHEVQTTNTTVFLYR